MKVASNVKTNPNMNMILNMMSTLNKPNQVKYTNPNLLNQTKPPYPNLTYQTKLKNKRTKPTKPNQTKYQNYIHMLIWQIKTILVHQRDHRLV